MMMNRAGRWGLVATLLVGLGVCPARAALSLGEATLLIEEAGRVERPAISPDGGRVAVVIERGGVENLWVVALDGGAPVQLTRETRANVQIGGARWSPDGAYLVYTSNKGESGSFDLWIISADGQHDEPLTTEPSLDWMPAWSPDGRRIAFVSDREGGDALWVIGVDGANLRRVAELAYEPAWSPDGRTIAAYHIEGGEDGVFLFDVDGGSPPRLALAQGRMPSFSEDGRYIVAVRSDATGDRLWVADLQSDRDTPLSGAIEGVAWPSWGPRGPRLAYERVVGGRKQVYVAAVIESRPLAALTEPAAGSSVRGAVRVRGTAALEGGQVASWRLEAGQGASPSSWTQVAEGTGAVSGELARWDTAGLEGLYTLRLTVVSEAGETTVTTLPVTVYGQYGVRWDRHDVPPTMIAGKAYEVTFAVTNTGTMTWRNDGQFPVEGGYRWVDAAGLVVATDGRGARFEQAVGAEETAVLRATVEAPAKAGQYTLHYDLRLGGQVWFGEQGAQALEVAVNVVVEYGAEYEAPSPPSVMVPGQIYTVELQATNRGAAVWPGGPGKEAMVVVARWRDLAGGLVDAPPLPTPLPNDVAPGQSVKVAARVQAPAVGGRYRLVFDLQDGVGLLSERTGEEAPGVDITVSAPYAVSFLEHNTPGRMFPGEILTVNLQCRNTGSVRWRATGPTAVLLSYRWRDRSGAVKQADSIATELPYDVLPGMNAALTARVQTPGEPGEYTLVWDLRQAGGRWFEELGNVPLTVPVMVGARTHSVKWEQLSHPVEMVVGALYTVELRLVNTGAMTWAAEGPDAVRLGYHWVRADGEELSRAPIFTSLSRPINQGEEERIAARVQAPDRPGDYLLRWDLYQGGYDFFSRRGAETLDLPIKVQVVYGARYVSHDTPGRLVAGTRYAVNLRVANTGTVPWESKGNVPVALSYRWYSATGDEVVVPTRTPATLARTVRPGESIEITAYLDAPTQPGRYDLEWDLLFAGALWFSDKGVEPLRVSVTVE